MDNKIIHQHPPTMPDLTESNEMLKDIWNRKNNNPITDIITKNWKKELAAWKVPYVSLFTNGTLPADCIQALRITGKVITTSLQLCGNHPHYPGGTDATVLWIYRPGNGNLRPYR